MKMLTIPKETIDSVFTKYHGIATKKRKIQEKQWQKVVGEKHISYNETKGVYRGYKSISGEIFEKQSKSLQAVIDWREDLIRRYESDE